MPTPLTAAGYAEDLEFLFKTVQEAHPRPDFRTSQPELETMMALCRARVAQCTSPVEFWRLAQDFFLLMGDGHSFLLPPQEGETRRAPVETVLAGGRVAVQSLIIPEACPGISVGDLIVAVGGLDVEERLHLAATHRPRNTSRYGRTLAAREVLLFIGTDQDTVEVTVAKEDGSCVDVQLPLVSVDSPLLGSHHDKTLAWQFTHYVEGKILHDAELGYLRLRRCVEPDAINPSWLGLLGLSASDLPRMEEVCWSFFERLRSIAAKGLILDLRGNTGGDSAVGETLLKYLTVRDLTGYAIETRISGHTARWYPDEKPGTVLRSGHAVLTYPYACRLDEERLRGLRQFSGKVLVLIDSAVFSSGEWIAAELKANKLAAFVGEPTGGGGAVPGDQLCLELPRTRLQLRLSYKYFIPPGGPAIEDHGVYPDYWIEGSVEDLRRGHDSVLEFALNLART